MSMDLTHFLTNSQQKRYLKIILLFTVSYFFMGVSEGAFFNFSSTDTLVNFMFTLFCVGSSWWLFKQLHSNGIRMLKNRNISLWIWGVVMVLFLSVYITLLNWVYIELLWMENLGDTLFFSIVLPLAVVLFLAWSFLYPKLQEYILKAAKAESLVFEVSRGRERVRIPMHQILGFTVENKLTFLISSDGQKYISDQNLVSLEELLADQGFFRANRQLLLVKAAVTAYQPCANEKIKFSLHQAFGKNSTAGISRYKASAFRKWMAS